ELFYAAVSNFVLSPTAITSRNRGAICSQRPSTKTHPTTVPRGISVDQLVRTNVTSHNRARSDQTTPAQSDAANDRRIRPNHDSLCKPRLHRYPVRIAAARREIVSENSIRPKKHIIAHVHVLPDADSILDRDVIANRDAALDKSMIANVAIRSDIHVL